MSDEKEKGSNFYMLTAQILNDKNLSHAEKLTMAILNGLADEDGTCYPSNEWLGEKLDLGENAIRKILQNLENHNYIHREIISCVKNPFKKYRIIYICTNFKLNLPPIENEGFGVIESEGTDPSKTRGIIDKKESLIDKKEVPPPPQAAELSLLLFEAIKKTKPDLKKPNLDKWAKDIDLMMRLDKRSYENIKKVIEWLHTDDFWKDKLLSADKLRSKFDQLELKMMQKPKFSLSDAIGLIKKLETRKDLTSSGKLILGENYVEFPLSRVYLHVGEKDFREKVIENLKKIGVKIV